MSALIVCLCFAAWAGLHSLLATLKIKRLAERLFGAGARRWYRLAFAAVAVLTLAPLVLLLALLPDRLVYAVPSPWRWLMVAGQAAAAVGLVWTVRATGAADFVGLRHLRGADSEAALVTHGLYRLVRHPMYAAALLVMWLLPVMTLNLLAFFALVSVYFLVGSVHEEALLLRQFGREYEEYRRRVPRIIPGLRL